MCRSSIPDDAEMLILSDRNSNPDDRIYSCEPFTNRARNSGLKKKLKNENSFFLVKENEKSLQTFDIYIYRRCLCELRCISNYTIKQQMSFKQNDSDRNTHLFSDLKNTTDCEIGSSLTTNKQRQTIMMNNY